MPRNDHRHDRRTGDQGQVGRTRPSARSSRRPRESPPGRRRRRRPSRSVPHGDLHRGQVDWLAVQRDLPEATQEPPSPRRTSPAWSARAPVAASRSPAAARRSSRRGWRPSRAARTSARARRRGRTSYRRRSSAPRRRSRAASCAVRAPGGRGSSRRRCGSAPVTTVRSRCAPTPRSTSATTWSMTSSRVYGVVSRWTAPSGIVSGAAARPESIASRRSRSAWVASTGAGTVLGGTTGGAGRRVGGQVDLHLRRPGRPPSRCRGPRRRCRPSPMIARCSAQQARRGPPGTALTALTAAVTSCAADRDRRRRAPSTRDRRVPAGRCRTRSRARRPAAAIAAGRATSTPWLEHPPVIARNMRAGVEVAQAQPVATPRDVLDLPDPEGPSIATTTRCPRWLALSCSRSRRCFRRARQPTGGCVQSRVPRASASRWLGAGSVATRRARRGPTGGPGRGRCAGPRR